MTFCNYGHISFTHNVATNRMSLWHIFHVKYYVRILYVRVWFLIPWPLSPLKFSLIISCDHGVTSGYPENTLHYNTLHDVWCLIILDIRIKMKSPSFVKADWLKPERSWHTSEPDGPVRAHLWMLAFLTSFQTHSAPCSRSLVFSSLELEFIFIYLKNTVPE